MSTNLSSGAKLGYGRFTLDRQLGHGTVGAVWLVRDGHLDEDVALKILAPALSHSPATVEDLRRRFVILSVLERGVDRSAYRHRFGADVFDHLPELTQAVDLGLMRAHGDILHLTDAGIEQSDVIGLWLYSEHVQERMATYDAR